MRRIVIPENVRLINPVDDKHMGEPVEWRKVALEWWANDQRAIERGMESMVRWLGVVQTLKTATPGGAILLEDQDWSMLNIIVEQPNMKLCPYSVIAVVQLAEFGEAVRKAELYKPPASA